MPTGLTHDQIIQMGLDENRLPSEYYRSDAGGGGFGGTDFNSILQSAQTQMAKTNQPVIQSMEAQRDPLQKRYENLIQSITKTTSGELGKRGILPSSTLFGQEVNAAVAPTYAERESALANLNTAIAQLQAGAGQNAVTTALDLYKFQQQQQKPTPYQTVGAEGGYIIDPTTGNVINTLQKLTGGGGGGYFDYLGGGGGTIPTASSNKLLHPSQYKSSWPKPPPGFGYNTAGQIALL